MTNSISIKKTSLVSLIQNTLENNKSNNDWSICVDVDGDLALMHSTYDKSSCAEICDMDFGDSTEVDGLFPGDDGYQYDQAANWLAEIIEKNAQWSIEINDEAFDLEFIDE